MIRRLRRLLLAAVILAPLGALTPGCSSAETTPDAAAQDPSPRALDPAPQAPPVDSPPFGNPRPKIAPEAALAAGGKERQTIR